MSLFENEADGASPRSAGSESSGTNGSALNSPRVTGSNRNRWLSGIAVVTTLLAVLGTVFIGWQVRDSIRELTRQSLKSTLASSVTAIEFWLAERRDDAEQLCANEELHQRSADLLDREHDASTSGRDVTADPDAANSDASDPDALNSSASDLLRASVTRTTLSDQYLGWVLIDMSGHVAASSHDELEGQRFAIPADAIQRVEDSHSTVSRPVACPVAIPRDGSPLKKGNAVMLAMAPVRRGARPVGAFGLLLDPMDRFSAIFASSQTGKTDETYAFDRSATMISRSRFEYQLRASGLLPSDPQITSPLNVRLFDPGSNLTGTNSLPKDWNQNGMTVMADQATRGATGENVTGYRDYRGVPVVGAWRWLPAYDFGVTTEMDVAEAYGPMRLLRNSFLGLFALLVGCVGSLLMLVNLLRGGSTPPGDGEFGRRLGQYDIGRLIGHGGMGSVYRGKHHMLRRDVAVKVLEGTDVTSKSMVRFEREVQMTSQLQHPNTIDIYDYGRSQDGTFFYVMEYVDGISLQQLVHQYGRQPPDRVIALLVQICRSLSEAHGASMVHRDVKPANVLITARAGFYDLVKVVDFGLVKQIDRETVQLTQSDAITGSPQFMSPEAIRDASIADARSDLYSVGAVGYFLLTGVTLFDSESTADVCVKQLNEEPMRPDERIDESLPEDFQNVLMSCLRKMPEDRPQSVGDLADALEQCVDGKTWTEADESQWWDAFFRSRSP